MKVDNTICAVVVGTPGGWQLALSTYTSRDAHAAATIKDHGPELQMWGKQIGALQHLKSEDTPGNNLYVYVFIWKNPI